MGLYFKSILIGFAILAWCLAPAPLWAQNAPATPPSFADVPDEYLQEALEYSTFCEANDLMRQYYDCECLGMRFLDERTELGPTVARDTIRFSLSNECRDATEASGMAYTACMKTTSTMSPGTDPEKYCECVGNTYSKLIDQKRPAIDSRSIVHFSSQARIICEDPDLARSLKMQIPK